MTALPMGAVDRFSTSTSQVAISACVVFACALALYLFGSVDAVQSAFGYAREAQARVPTFFVRAVFLIIAIVAAFLMVTGTGFYKRNGKRTDQRVGHYAGTCARVSAFNCNCEIRNRTSNPIGVGQVVVDVGECAGGALGEFKPVLTDLIE